MSEGFDVLIDYRPMNLHGQKIAASSPVNISQTLPNNSAGASKIVDVKSNLC
jgi:hypothetical protein